MVILTIAACLVGGARSDTHTSHHPHLFVHSLLAQQSHDRFQENPPDISYCQRQWRNSVDFIGGGGGGVGANCGVWEFKFFGQLLRTFVSSVQSSMFEQKWPPPQLRTWPEGIIYCFSFPLV